MNQLAQNQRTNELAARIGARVPLKFVPETHIGFWFLGTQTWESHVVRVALDDLERLFPARAPSYPVVLDAGCGQGKSFRFLHDRFAPRRLIGVDAELKCLARAHSEAHRHGLNVEIKHGDIGALDLGDASVDLVFCHQTLHHLTRQEQTLREFYRVLKPGGVLLFAESTRVYIHSWIIRLFFRHPMDKQRSASEFQSMLRAQGFAFSADTVSCPYLWWSRPDLGVFEQLGFPVPVNPEPTLINLVATKPK